MSGGSERKYRDAMTSGRELSAVLLDLTVRGGLCDMDCISRLLEIDSEVKAVVSSGYTDDATMSY